MINDQCRANCQCDWCEENPKQRSGNAGLSVNGAGMSGKSRDATYQQSLRNSLRSRALMSSTQNAARFIPDEQLQSSMKRRDAKDRATAADMVALRRRDRLQGLLILENKARLREEGRIRAERRAMGLPETEEEEALLAQQQAEEEERARQEQEGGGVAIASRGLNLNLGAPGSAQGSDGQRRLSGASTPASRCSAEHDLHAVMRDVQGVMEMEEGPGGQLTHEQVYRLRQIIHEQEKKTRTMIDESGQPYLCNHCLTNNVQAKYLPQPGDESVAFATTGKVINFEEGLKYGTDVPRAADGTYRAADVPEQFQRSLSAKPNTGSIRGTGVVSGASIDNHPYGTGVVFNPYSSARSQPNLGGTKYNTLFNNNIGADEEHEPEYQYPGSTYNVYDGRPNALAGTAGSGAAPRSGNVTPGSQQPQAPQQQRSRNVNFAVDGAAKGQPQQQPQQAATAAAPAGQRGAAPAAAAAPGGSTGGIGGAPGAQPPSNSTAALWRTTNQYRDDDMRRFMEFQQEKLRTNKQMTYDSGSGAKVPSSSTY